MDKNINKTPIKIDYKITPEGSLGLLAFGDIGLKAWRKVRNAQSHKLPSNE